MSWWTSIDFHRFADTFTLIVVWLIFPAALAGAYALPEFLKGELFKAFSRKPGAEAHGADGGKPGEQSVSGK